jgi:hypothetical protein
MPEITGPSGSTVAGISDVPGLQAALDAKQALDSDLTAIAALSTTSYGRALLELANQAALQTAVGAQPLDSDLTAIAALTPSNNDVLQRKSGAWANRTIAQLLTDLGVPTIIRGHIKADATIYQGSGFSVARLGGAPAGRYVITFTSAFAATPVVVANIDTQSPSTTSPRQLWVSGVSTTGVQIEVSQPNVAYLDFDFFFVAVSS